MENIDLILFGGAGWAWFPVERLCALLLDILLVILKLKNKGWLHGDISLQNVMYCSRKDHYKLIDYGFAQLIGNNDPNGPSGTHGFISHSVLKGYPKTVATEVYSLSLVVEHVLDSTIMRSLRAEGYVPEETYTKISAFRTIIKSLQRSKDICEYLEIVYEFYCSLRYHMPECVRKDKRRCRRVEKTLHKIPSATSSIPTASLDILPIVQKY